MSKHTPGPCMVDRFTVRPAYAPDCHDTVIAVCDDGDGYAQATANANLIAEAFTVATETGLTPRQLAEQRAELLAALQRCLNYMENTESEFGITLDSAEAARSIIAKAKGEQP